MIYTNREQRPEHSRFASQDVSDLIDNVLTPGRIRQIARGFPNGDSTIGWSQFSCVWPDDGVFQFPFPIGHVYDDADVERVEEFVRRCHAEDPRYKVKMDRWYSQNDILSLVKRSKRLTKLLRNGQLPKVRELMRCEDSTLELNEDVAMALKASHSQTLSVEIPGFESRFVLVEQSTYDEATAALEYQRNVEAIRVGVRQMEAGMGRPLDEAMDDIREKLIQRMADVAKH